MSVEQPVPSVDSGDSPAPVRRTEIEGDQLAGGWLTGVTFALVGACLAWGLLLALPPPVPVALRLTVALPWPLPAGEPGNP